MTAPARQAAVGDMGRRFVVGYDGTPAAEAAVRFAVARAGPFSHVCATLVIESPPEWGGTRASQRRDRASRREAKKLLSALSAAVASDRLGTRLLAGDPAAAIAELADELAAHEIILGSRGRGPVHALLGSVCRTVLSRTRRPLTVISPTAAAQAPLGPPGRVAAAIKPGVDPQPVVDAACGVLPAGAELVVVTADGIEAGVGSAVPAEVRCSRAHQAAETAAALARGRSVRTAIHIGRGHVDAVLETAAVEHDIDLIVVGRSSRGKLAEPLCGSAPAALIAGGSRPVLNAP